MSTLLGWVDRFDQWSFVAMNSYAQAHPLFHKALMTLNASPFFKAAPIVVMLVWAWSARPQSPRFNQRAVVAIVLSAGIAIACGRAAQVLLPARLRPIQDAGSDFAAIHGVSPEVLSGWSSFPSDHAVYFAALSVGLYVLDKRLGVVAALWSLFVICLPRIYIGLHYPSDIIAGLLLGGLVMELAVNSQPVLGVADALIDYKDRAPSTFFPIAVLILWQMGVMFEDVRRAGSMSSNMVKYLAGHEQPAQPLQIGHVRP
ncbi:MAG: phosphatase PAP2 family protein [Hyphomicrobium sp.]